MLKNQTMLSDKCILCFEVGNEKNDDGICAQCSKILNELGYEKSFKENVRTIAQQRINENWCEI